MISTPTTLSEGSDEEYDACSQDFPRNHLQKGEISKKNVESDTINGKSRLDAFIECTRDEVDVGFSD